MAKFQYITCYSLSVLQRFRRTGLAWFQYITCYSLSEKRHNRTARKRVSIHHMLLFIVISLIDQPSLNDVSIHHMLLFIVYAVRSLFRFCCFNTSHVTLYLDKKVYKQVECCLYTSHVTLYRWMLMLLCKTISSFNTSHVTLYREAARRHVIWLMFQYITCYSLS